MLLPIFLPMPNYPFHLASHLLAKIGVSSPPSPSKNIFRRAITLCSITLCFKYVDLNYWSPLHDYVFLQLFLSKLCIFIVPIKTRKYIDCLHSTARAVTPKKRTVAIFNEKQNWGGLPHLAIEPGYDNHILTKYLLAKIGVSSLDHNVVSNMNLLTCDIQQPTITKEPAAMPISWDWMSWVKTIDSLSWGTSFPQWNKKLLFLAKNRTHVHRSWHYTVLILRPYTTSHVKLYYLPHNN